MYAKVHEEIASTDIFVGCAAVSDYRPDKVAPQKIKRSAAEMELALVRSPDTLASVAALPKPPFTVGFAAETQEIAKHAREKLEKKRVDMIAANQVGPDCGFDRETNALTVFWQRRRGCARRRLEARARAPARGADRGALPRRAPRRAARVARGLIPTASHSPSGSRRDCGRARDSRTRERPGVQLCDDSRSDSPTTKEQRSWVTRRRGSSSSRS